MSLQLPNLDDRNFSDLVAEALALLPRYAPEWTNHNPSDPGITLIELLAYFTEMLLYQLNRISLDNKIQFLKLLQGPGDWCERLEHASREEVDEEIRRAVLALREPQRAVTREDFQYLARRATTDKARGDLPRVARAFCSSRRNLEADTRRPDATQPGHVSLVVVPDRELDAQLLDRLIDRVVEFLRPRCLLTTQLHVVGPCYVWISLRLEIRMAAGVGDRMVAADKLERLFGPYPECGPEGEGWPFGRAFHLAEVESALGNSEAIQRVEDVRVMRLALNEPSLQNGLSDLGLQIGIRSSLGVDARLGADPSLGGGRFQRSDDGRLLAVILKPHELLRVRLFEEDLQVGGAVASGMDDWAWSVLNDG